MKTECPCCGATINVQTSQQQKPVIALIAASWALNVFATVLPFASRIVWSTCLREHDPGGTFIIPATGGLLVLALLASFLFIMQARLNESANQQ